MDDTALLSQFIKETYTKKDIARRLRLLREYFEGGFFTFTEMEVTKFLLGKHATMDDIHVFVSWGKDFYDAFSKETMYARINALHEAVKKLPHVVMYIPYEPVPAEIVKLGKWCRQNIGGDLVVDLRTDITLLGGCAFVWKGVYRDYSLRYYMRKKKAEITRLVTEYVQKFYDQQMAQFQQAAS